MKYICILLSFIFYTSAIAQVDKIDHLYVSSADAKTLYNFFKNNFQLPIAWNYEDYGDFSSGAFSLGNAAIEFVKFKDTSRHELAGIALQPHEQVERLITTLDSKNIMHDSIEPFTFNLDNGAKDTAWETVALKKVLPDNVNLFICDYKNRKEVYERIKETADSLTILHGGKLGITGLKEIVVGSKDLALNSSQLSKLSGLTREKNNLFKFDSGPSIRLINSDSPGIEKIVVLVNSIDNAKKYLQSKKILGKATRDSLFIDAQELEGLTIQLVEK